MFFCNPQKSSVTVCLMKILKSTIPKKVIVCFYDLGEENFSSFVILPTSMMVLFEIHRMFNGPF